MILINKYNVIKISKNLENELKVYKNNNQNINIPKLLYYKKETKQHILIIKNTGLNLINVYNQLSLYDLNNLYICPVFLHYRNADSEDNFLYITLGNGRRYALLDN